jgi:hypothetical protein
MTHPNPFLLDYHQNPIVLVESQFNTFKLKCQKYEITIGDSTYVFSPSTFWLKTLELWNTGNIYMGW